MSLTTKTPCPICRTGRLLNRHCPESNPVCSWTRCPGCKVTLDIRRKSGLLNGQPILWPTAPQ